MSTDALPKDLLEQARSLLNREPKRPKQASLRRAISTAYYAVFHLLCGETSKLLAPNVGEETRNHIRRWMEHGEVKVVCGGFSKPPKTSPYRDLLDPAGSADLQRIAANFTFTRVQASALVQQASDCFDAWSAVRKTSDANVFLLSLLMRKHWDKPR